MVVEFEAKRLTDSIRKVNVTILTIMATGGIGRAGAAVCIGAAAAGGCV